MTVTATFQLLEEPPEPEPEIVDISGTSAVSPFSERAGIGRGLLVPFRRDGKSDFANGSGAALIRSNILQVLGVRADDGNMTGELPWRPNFGSLLRNMMFDNIDEVFAILAQSRILAALAAWEPRARVTGIKFDRIIDGSGNTAKITLTYDIIQSSTGNLLVTNQQAELAL